MDSYLPRVADALVASSLSRSGAVLIEGPRACGKTMTAQRFAQSAAFLDTTPGLIVAATTDPPFVLAGARPRLIDEWQLAPQLWNAARHEIDRTGADGQFIFTGSATPVDDVTRHSGAGRFSRIRMRPMSMYEQGVAPGGVSLAALRDGVPSRAQDAGLGLDAILDAVARGGWPRNLNRSLDDAIARMRDYVREIEATGIDALDGMRRDPVRVRAVLRALARNTATEAKIATIARDAAGFAGLGTIDPETVAGYLAALERIHIVEHAPAWRGHIRSSAVNRVAPKRFFVDPSVAVAALEMSAEDLRDDLEFVGMLFESLVVRDLRVIAGSSGGTVTHYRDSAGLEVDAVITFGYRSWIACEIKMASTGPRVEEAAAVLHSFARRADTAQEGAPRALVVVVGSGPAYVRPDGVHVVPLWALQP